MVSAFLYIAVFCLMMELQQVLFADPSCFIFALHPNPIFFWPTKVHLVLGTSNSVFTRNFF